MVRTVVPLTIAMFKVLSLDVLVLTVRICVLGSVHGGIVSVAHCLKIVLRVVM